MIAFKHSAQQCSENDLVTAESQLVYFMFLREGKYSQSCILIGRFGYLYWKLIVVFLFLIHFTMKRLSIGTRDPGTLTARPAITDLHSKMNALLL